MNDLFLLTLCATAVSLVLTAAVVHLTPRLATLTGDHQSGPQKFHSHQVSRIGGVGLFAGFAAGAAVLWGLDTAPGLAALKLAAAALPAFCVGLAEDVTKRVGVATRLLATMASAGVCIVLLGTQINRLDVPGLDTLLTFGWVAFAFTCFAVAGIANAINIVDGYNGLSGGICIIALAAMAIVAGFVGDVLVIHLSLILAGAIAGFLVWNYPGGRIFLGDGGAYVAGFLLAEIGILLVLRNPQVSPWFPLMVLAYPVWETLFSVYRKKLLRNQSPGQPDGLHFHMLVYKRCVRHAQFRADTAGKIRRNSYTSPYLWCLGLICAVPAILWWSQSGVLAVCAFAFAGLYGLAYRRMALFGVPGWLIRR